MKKYSGNFEDCQAHSSPHTHIVLQRKRPIAFQEGDDAMQAITQNKKRIKVQHIVGAGTAQVDVVRNIQLPVRARKIVDIHTEIVELDYEIIPNKVIVKGALHKQVYYVEEGDYVQSILFGPDKMDLLIKIGEKILRVPAKQIPYLKRSTRGARISTGTALVDSMNFINPNCQDVVVVTKSGMVNKLGINIIEPTNRGRAGIKVIKLKKDDQIISVLPTLPNSSLVVYEGGRSNTIINIEDIPYGITAGTGVKLLKNPIRVMVQQNN